MTIWSLLSAKASPCTAVAGEVPNLFPKDERTGGLEDVRPAAKTAGAGETAAQRYACFLERGRTNLHVILCLSPIGSTFRERCRMFPGGLCTQQLHMLAYACKGHIVFLCDRVNS